MLFHQVVTAVSITNMVCVTNTVNVVRCVHTHTKGLLELIPLKQECGGATTGTIHKKNIMAIGMTDLVIIDIYQTQIIFVTLKEDNREDKPTIMEAED